MLAATDPANRTVQAPNGRVEVDAVRSVGVR